MYKFISIKIGKNHNRVIYTYEKWNFTNMLSNLVADDTKKQNRQIL